jgi:RHS repeat-associated protein
MDAADKLYNGNIAETFWSTATDGGYVRNYGYKYDSLNRLKDATYQKSGQLTGMYNESLSYDKNGNIMNLSRYGDRDEQYLPIQIDNLGYTYGTNSNQLKSVTDATNNTSGFKDGNTTGDDYVYDRNGNMTVDKNKNITAITYNHLNLPTQITFGTTGNIVYIYTASGQKVKKVVTSTTPASVVTTDYLGGYQYSNSSLQFFPTAEGYVKNTPVSGTNSYSYVFNYTDHLGNVRLSYTKNPSTNALTILDENNYYPFGLTHKGYNNLVSTNNPAEKLLYNGKELQDELGLDMYDFGARLYDRQLNIWRTIDPFAEKFSYVNPYVYCLNNPVNMVDPDGKAPENDYGIDDAGKVRLIKETTDKTDRLIAKNGDVIDNKVQKGILNDGMDLGKNVNMINLSQENSNGDKVQMSEINDMLFKLSVYNQKEISWGKYESSTDKNGWAIINGYSNNKHDEATNNVGYQFSRNNQNYLLIEDYHTHPSFAKGYGHGDPSTSGGDISSILREKNTKGYIISREASLTRYDFNDGNSGFSPVKNMRSQIIDKDYVKKNWGWKKSF